jgi:hypothetical protein
VDEPPPAATPPDIQLAATISRPPREFGAAGVFFSSTHQYNPHPAPPPIFYGRSGSWTRPQSAALGKKAIARAGHVRPATSSSRRLSAQFSRSADDVEPRGNRGTSMWADGFRTMPWENPVRLFSPPLRARLLGHFLPVRPGDASSKLRKVENALEKRL